jgi:DNA repair exonuclease SbcCD ATPase subunit
MKEILLESLEICNFMGLDPFELAPEGESVKVIGQNGSGKTTLKHAFNWLLVGKDAEFNALNPKIVRRDGTEVHNVDSVVEGTFRVEGTTVKLKRIQKENWVKKRGSNEKSFSGHITKFYIDEVPVKEKDYKSTVAEIFGGEDALKALVDPFYIAEKIPWQRRRELIMNLCGEVKEDEVFAKNPDLLELQTLKGNRTLEQFKLVLKDKMSEINTDLQVIPGKIDELSRFAGVPEGTPALKDLKADKKEINGRLKELRELITPKSDERKEIEIADIRSKMGHLERQQEEEERGYSRQIDEQIHPLGQRYKVVESKILDLGDPEARVKVCNNRVISLRKAYNEVSISEFSLEEKICELCGQEIPEELQEEAFSRGKAIALEKIREEGKDFSAKLNGAKKALAEKNELQVELEKLMAEILELQAKKLEMPPADLPEEYFQLKERLEVLTAEDGNEDIKTLSAYKEKIKELKADKELINDKIELYSRAKDIKKRLKELKEMEESLADNWSELERQKYLVEEFIRTEVSLIETKVVETLGVEGLNVKLFQEQVNGGLREVCELTYDGIPFGGTLNYGHRVFIGLCLIMSMQEYYGLRMPVFVDNAESLTFDLDFKWMQLILLEAKAGVEKLKAVA